MKGANRTTVVLAGVTGLLLALALLDRAGLFSSEAGPDESEPTTLRARYRVMAEGEAKRSALIESALNWESSLVEARGEWARARQGLIVARTIELAEARFRDRILSLVQDCGGESARALPERSAGPEANSMVRAVAVRVEFDVHDPAAAYRFVERIEGMADPRANIESLAIDGPGRIQGHRTLGVSALVRAIALVGEEP